MPPEVRLIQAVSGRRASASATAAAALGVHWTRITQDLRPSRSGSTSPRTRSSPDERSRLYRRATVWSDTPSTSPIRLNGARPSICSA